ncbi:nucleotide disphospho-sugar-binding domain-containing protein [Rouxiella sp. Mn2063]|uniref:nucleotide disphospho-sugar-binding domain-containing protein n=1 Tax=Rouxiella sp. Mn2063 TaxID=3395262 RepID=UPI003BECC8C8
MAAVATPGHIFPILDIGKYLVAQGHQVTVLTGELFRERSETIGAKFVPFDARVDFDYRHLEEHFPQRAALPPGNAQMALALKDFFAAPIPLLHQQLLAVIKAEAIDVVIIENGFYGVLPLLQLKERPVVFGVGVTPLPYSSRDSVFYGPRIAPALLPYDLSREQLVDKETQTLIDEVQQSFNVALELSGGSALRLPFTDALIAGCDSFFQLSTAALEYARDDLPQNLHFIGALKGSGKSVVRNIGWDQSDSRPLVVVTQGTIANVDFNQLIIPTLNALAQLPVRILVTTGGREVDGLIDKLPANAKVQQFISFDDWFGQASLFITNGGYGTINQALEYGVPLIIAGVGEDKQEAAMRIVAAGCGINLRTSYPSEAQLLEAATRILQQPSYRQRAELIQADYARHDPLATIAADVLAFTR